MIRPTDGYFLSIYSFFNVRNLGLERAIGEYTISYLIHLAALLLLPACKANPLLGAQVNVLGGLNILEAVRRNSQIQRVVYASSIVVYEAVAETVAIFRR